MALFGKKEEKTKDEKTKDVVKKPIYKKWWFWVIIIIFLVKGLGSTSSDEKVSDVEIEKIETKEVKETNKEEVEEIKEELSNEETIKKRIEETVGEENLESFNYVPENNFSLIKFKGTESLSNKMTVKSMYLDMFDILRKIQPKIDTDVTFNVVYPLVDKYGNSEDEIVIKATFTKETIDRINFDKALFGDIPYMADEWWNSPAVDISK